jgi:hypothetical protein
MRVWLRRAAWLCLSLMLWTAAAESTHHHPSASEAASCSICVVAHTASPAVPTSHGTPVFVAVGIFHEEDVASAPQFEFSDLDIRGPPASV